jgi:hypothetical protein
MLEIMRRLGTATSSLHRSRSPQLPSNGRTIGGGRFGVVALAHLLKVKRIGFLHVGPPPTAWIEGLR